MNHVEIRDNPGLRSFVRNVAEWSITSLMWGVWIYFVLPVMNILLWLLGFKYVHIELIEKIGYREFIDLATKMGWVVLTVFAILRLWGYYNYRRFGQRNRRRRVAPLTVEQLSEHFGISVEEVSVLKEKKEIFCPPPDSSSPQPS